MQITGTYTDQYQLTMGQAYFLKGDGEKTAIFDYFFRKLPFKGGYAVFAGLEVVLEILENFHFTDSDIAFLKQQKFNSSYIAYLKDFRFKGSIYSTLEGDIIFPNCPVLTIEATIIEAQLIETLLLNMLNFQTLIATKASRSRQSAGNRVLIDFGMRRAHGPAAHLASRAAIIGGFNATSNVLAAKDFDIPVSGTMAHSFVQSFDEELEAFRFFAKVRPNDCILLVDTYSTLKSGVPNAITVAKEMESKGQKLKGIRLDSGDLAYLAKQARKMLDEASLQYVQIAVSNQLDEYVIKSLLEQDAPIDVFGVGTSLVIGKPDAALDGVYKLAFAYGKPRIKLSENTTKITLPFKKQVHRLYDSNHKMLGADLITLWEETEISKMYHPLDAKKNVAFNNCKAEALLQLVMKNGKRIFPSKSVADIASYSANRLQILPEEFKRFDNPHIYKVGLSKLLNEEREKLIVGHKMV
ncbi:MAG: nicotinate phosphoribosyltransferase [Flavobacteriaceae bacterium CG_4_8_14_3_um_filter_34_10]|nr:nicotinate phosphoribosyltransferase [Flavobacteriia bacterium]PIQ17907.1 MAG: nicotinate phosphoribosyltransferase [Flavobacteriaceae bacterium CG18_big_fil_WC_8_21_14_2_50_34_36]PIX09635.1 MAG: nicotinate phosphoribosyltransferase [Flavobacteriaceae bacterium CG_4_8_14_3_um_filter_34_10]PIZ08919.1 MAG: nicotinate phosphoribosyltransferase [Flavobacteriaceae bacterium CG_4_10_14_0_8_um_filter_34_31]PJC07609.1 MAG: nicotinate phosphoribosyltransferase [Flavobacteriaceae bacterium CG_4_9_14_0